MEQKKTDIMHNLLYMPYQSTKQKNRHTVFIGSTFLCITLSSSAACFNASHCPHRQHVSMHHTVFIGSMFQCITLSSLAACFQCITLSSLAASQHTYTKNRIRRTMIVYDTNQINGSTTLLDLKK